MDTPVTPRPRRFEGSRAAVLQRSLAIARSGSGDPDTEFDAVYPRGIREVSRSFWTPMRVALRAAELLVTSPATRVLDVGSGVGKFCIIGAATTGATFVGVEHRARFVSVAAAVASAFGVSSTSFVCKPFDAVDVDEFDAMYFFNPFEENLWSPVEHLDATVQLSSERFCWDTVQAERMLAGARVGTRVVTYHGFGSNMPPGFRLAVRERQRTDYLELWEKTEDLPWVPRERSWHLLSGLPSRKLRALQAIYRSAAMRSLEADRLQSGVLARSSVAPALRRRG